MVFNFKAFAAPRVLRFIFLTTLRIVGIVAICLVIGAELQEMVRNIQGYAKAIHSSPEADPTDNNLPGAHTGSLTNIGSLASGIGIGPFSTSQIQPFREACGYVEGTTVPDHAAGILFSTLFRFLNLLVLVLLLVSEISPPWPPLTNFFLRFFPPLSEDSSTGFLGAAMLWLSTSVLSTSVQQFALIGAWFLFVIGILNLLLSLIMGSSIRKHRSIIDSDKSKRPELPTTSFTAVKVSKKGKVSYLTPVDIGEIGFPTPAYGAHNVSRGTLPGSEYGFTSYTHSNTATGPLTRPSEMVEKRAGSPTRGAGGKTRSGKGILKIRTPEEEEDEENRIDHRTPPSYAH